MTHPNSIRQRLYESSPLTATLTATGTDQERPDETDQVYLLSEGPDADPGSLRVSA